MREPVNAWTHLIGAIISAVGLTVLLGRAVEQKSVSEIVAFSVYGGSLILMYGASAAYHSLNLSEGGLAKMRRLDHIMIYILIAGTYTPICLVLLHGRLAWGLLVAIWTIAALGMLQKAAWMRAPRWLSTALYLGMGWLVVLIAGPLLRVAPAGFFAWLLAGGVFYSLGALVYAAKWPRRASNKKSPLFGFHEIWHLFVMAGSFSHYWAILTYMSK